MKTTENRKTKRSHALTVAYATGALFVILMAVLVYRLEAGLDPSIGTASYKIPAVAQRKVVVNRRIVKVIHDKPVEIASSAGGGVASGSGAAPQAPSGGSYSAPAVPQASTPTPAPAPAPAPATKAS